MLIASRHRGSMPPRGARYEDERIIGGRATGSRWPTPHLRRRPEQFSTRLNARITRERRTLEGAALDSEFAHIYVHLASGATRQVEE